jgi:hypothetical protein
LHSSSTNPGAIHATERPNSWHAIIALRCTPPALVLLGRTVARLITSGSLGNTSVAQQLTSNLSTRISPFATTNVCLIWNLSFEPSSNFPLTTKLLEKLKPFCTETSLNPLR